MSIAICSPFLLQQIEIIDLSHIEFLLYSLMSVYLWKVLGFYAFFLSLCYVSADSFSHFLCFHVWLYKRSCLCVCMCVFKCV